MNDQTISDRFARTAGVIPTVLPGSRGQLDWTVEPGLGSTSIVDSTIRIPFGPNHCERCDTDHNRPVRIHEMSHARYSPKRMKRAGTVAETLPDWALEYAEETRVNFLAGKAIPDYREMTVLCGSGETDQLVNRLVSSNGVAGVVCSIAAARFTGDYVGVLESLHRFGDKSEPEVSSAIDRAIVLTTKAINRHIVGVPRWRNSVALAEEFARIAEMIGNTTDGSDPNPIDNLDDASERPPDETTNGEWATVNVVEPPLVKRLISHAKRTVTRDIGTVPRSVWRLPIDSKIYRSSKRKRTGSVLIDVSGSMSLSPFEIREMVETIPAGIIATYCADRNEDGWLTIVAKNGRAVADGHLVPRGANNGIDGPALKWLSEQPQPRLWVSDGWITGSDWGSHPNLARECRDTVTTNRITMVETVGRAIDLLRGKRKRGRPVK